MPGKKKSAKPASRGRKRSVRGEATDPLAKLLSRTKEDPKKRAQEFGRYLSDAKTPQNADKRLQNILNNLPWTDADRYFFSIHYLLAILNAAKNPKQFISWLTILLENKNTGEITLGKLPGLDYFLKKEFLDARTKKECFDLVLKKKHAFFSDPKLVNDFLPVIPRYIGYAPDIDTKREWFDRILDDKEIFSALEWKTINLMLRKRGLDKQDRLDKFIHLLGDPTVQSKIKITDIPGIIFEISDPLKARALLNTFPIADKFKDKDFLATEMDDFIFAVERFGPEGLCWSLEAGNFFAEFLMELSQLQRRKESYEFYRYGALLQYPELRKLIEELFKSDLTVPHILGDVTLNSREINAGLLAGYLASVEESKATESFYKKETRGMEPAEKNKLLTFLGKINTPTAAKMLWHSGKSSAMAKAFPYRIKASLENPEFLKEMSDKVARKKFKPADIKKMRSVIKKELAGFAKPTKSSKDMKRTLIKMDTMLAQKEKLAKKVKPAKKAKVAAKGAAKKSRAPRK